MKRMLAIAALLLLAWAVWPDGQMVRADRPTRDLGELKPGQEMEVAFDLTNLKGVPVRVVGADCPCPRLCAKNIPFTIPPRGIAPFKVTFHAPESVREFEESFNVFVDGPGEPVHLTIVGRTK